MKAWKEKLNRDHRGTPGTFKELEQRAAMLAYAKNPSETLDYVKKHLSLRFDHRQRGSRAAAPSETYPSELDNGLIASATLLEEALKKVNNGREQLTHAFTPHAYAWIVQQGGLSTR